MRIAHVAAEVVPYAKTGGLADVAAALPRALARLGHEPVVVTPWYDGLGGEVTPFWIGDVEVPFGGGVEPVGIGTAEAHGVRFAFVGHDDYRRGALYGFEDDARRFARLTRAVPQVLARIGFAPELVHVHDWHAAWLPLVLKRGWHLPAGMPGVRTVLTIHNLQHQGPVLVDEALRWLRLPQELSAAPLAHKGRTSALRCGILHADAIVTVSPRYAREILTAEHGFGLERALQRREADLTGILNGLDEEAWDPASDPALPRRYGPNDASDGKAAAAASLRERFGLERERPILGSVGRLADQKGVDLLLDALPTLTEQGWAVVIIGSGDPDLERAARAAAERFPGAVAVQLAYDDTLARLVYAGADAFAVPSRFEPCGLTQLIAMRYGALPVVRAVGGLIDTVRDGATGFLFQEAEAPALAAAALRARQALSDGSATAMRNEAMRQRFGWGPAARAYERIYRRVLADAPSGGTP